MDEPLIGYARCSTDEQDLLGEYTISDIGELCSVSRPTVHRTLKRPTAANT